MKYKTGQDVPPNVDGCSDSAYEKGYTAVPAQTPSPWEMEECGYPSPAKLFPDSSEGFLPRDRGFAR